MRSKAFALLAGILAVAVSTLRSDAIDRRDRAFAIAYYPTYAKLVLRLDVGTAFEAGNVTRTAARVVDERGVEIVRSELTGDTVRMAEIVLPELPDGSYRAIAEAEMKSGRLERFERRFERRRFEWEGNDLGRERTVFPPFEPLRIKGRAVDLVLRRYIMNELGLWDSISSLGHELLAGPITVAFETSAGRGQWLGRRAEFTRVDQDRAVFEAENDGGVVALRTRSTIDVDGCMQVELDLLPGSQRGTLRALSVEIPLRDSEAPLWHLVRSGDIRFNPAGTAPPGTGLVWASKSSDNGAMLGSFFPYLWLGGAERGLAFFADNDRGWVGGDQDSTLELVREHGTLRLRLRLVRSSVRVASAIHIVFGLQASPAKPLPKGWRGRTDISIVANNGAFWGMKSTYADKYPAGGDFSIADAFAETRRSGQVDQAFIDRWIRQNYADATPALTATRRLAIEQNFGLMAVVRSRPQIIYFDGSTQNLRSAEWAIFQDEWAADPFRPRNTQQAIRDVAEADEYRYLVPRSVSYQDFALWYAREWMRRGFGIGVDNVFLGNCYDTVVCSAYVREDGKVQPSAEVWRLREYFRRMWTLEKEQASHSPFPLLLAAHMTNALLLPVEAYVDLDVDIEWNYRVGVAEFPQRPDFLRAETCGRQVGVYPYALHALVGLPVWLAAHSDGADPAAAERLERTEWGMLFVHEIARWPSIFDLTRRPGWPTPDRVLESLVRGFGYGTDAVEVINYWDEPREQTPHVDVSSPDVKWIGLWKAPSKELLLALVNYANVAVRAPVGIDFQGEHPKRVFRDVESGAAWDGTTAVLDPGELRLLWAAVR